MENEFRSSIVAETIVEQILPKYFKFIIHESEIAEDGSMTKLYSQLAENIYYDVYDLIKKEIYADSKTNP